jgi:hypothetical protein
MILLITISLSATTQSGLPDPNNKIDLEKLGVGRIIEKDKSIITRVKLIETREYWVVYEKDGSLHDLFMDKIDHFEFWETKWGALQITFPANKSVVKHLNH